MDSEIHDEITTVKGSFEKTKKGILKLIENDIPMKISCPILKQNKNCYHDVIEWAEKHKIIIESDYEIIARYNHTTQNINNRLSIYEIKELINEKIKYEPNYIEEMKKTVENKKNSSPNDIVCSICHSSICIADNGNVYPCACWNNYIVGNVQETSLKEIWKNSEKIQYLRALRKKDFPKCIKCSEKEYCTMCMVRNANEDSKGDPLTVNEFFCDIAKLNKEIILESKY
jgi:radical SAM protein with 4Fe4S-binding SPASM domain